MTEILDQIESGLLESFLVFTNPHKRVFYMYWISTAVIALFAYFLTNKEQEKSLKGLIKFFFPKWLFTHYSMYVDYAFLFLNSMIKIVLFVPFLISHITIARFIVRSMDSSIGVHEATVLPASVIMCLYTVFFLVLNDFSRFYLHYLAHRVRFIWEFHKVHHSAEVMTPLTLFRAHPVERLLFYVRGSLSYGISMGVFYYFFRNQIDMYTIMGLNAGLFIFNLLGANLRHTHIWISYGKFWEKIFISPAQHQIHHGSVPEHYHKNMGSIFAFWDWMFGTLYTTTSKKEENLVFGLENRSEEFRTFWENIYSPFKRIVKA